MKNFTIALSCLLLSIGASAQCGAGEVEVQIEIHTDSYGYEGYWELVSVDSICGQGTILSGGNTAVGCGGAGQQNQTPGGYANNQTYTTGTACLTEGSDYRIIYNDDWGDGGFEFFVTINGYDKEDFTGQGAAHNFVFTAEEPPAYDLSMLHPHIKSYQPQGDIDIEAEVSNRGTETITDLTMHYTINSGTPQSQVVSGLSIANGASEHIIHPTPWQPTADGEYDITIWYSDLNGNNPDANPADDEVEVTVNIGAPVPNVIDSYLVNLPEIVEIANSSNQVNIPTDLDFHPVLTKYELWVLNKDSENTGSSTVTISNAGMSNQSTWWRRDGNAWHFMSLSTGIAFSENTNFATSPGVFDANHNGGSPFTGPALWSSDPSVYAQPSGGNGSHLDMLHESPECQGIASEIDNVFWVVDGFNRDIVRYDFADDHGPGNDDHDDGEVLRFSDVLVSPDPLNVVVSHLVYDKETDWLYVVDQGGERIIRINTKSGALGTTPSFGPYETLAEYRHVTGYDWEVVVDEGLDQPAGIDLIDDHLLVSDYATGEVIIYDISQVPATELKRIPTEAEGIMGIKLGPDGKIWYVDFDASTVNRIDWVPDTTVGISSVDTRIALEVYPNPSSGEFRVVHDYPGQVLFEILDLQGRMLQSGIIREGRGNISTNVSPGLYILNVKDQHGTASRQESIVIR